MTIASEPLHFQGIPVNKLNRDPELCRLFVSEARRFLAKQPEIQHSWSVDDDEDHAILEIQGKGDAGFDITVHIDSDAIILWGEGWHEHYSVTEPKKDFVAGMLGLIRDMLSPSMRIRERRSNGTPYKWTLENFEEGTWGVENTCALVFWNWFGTKTEAFYSNEVLPARTQAGV
ncbi:hypothetical protein DES53_101425 [Roseimicrobium gellanilyticum]|uniref:Uncharacterized protein n=1 Tax=Roseimicrobium gellanilyticum TaxID=748857 RepID=A0A366HWF7_9BACT|nr:hypothetical protein DES53_101425 [Roseimicrobium gellanilyticum]